MYQLRRLLAARCGLDCKVAFNALHHFALVLFAIQEGNGVSVGCVDDVLSKLFGVAPAHFTKQEVKHECFLCLLDCHCVGVLCRFHVAKVVSGFIPAIPYEQNLWIMAEYLPNHII